MLKINVSIAGQCALAHLVPHMMGWADLPGQIMGNPDMLCVQVICSFQQGRAMCRCKPQTSIAAEL